MLGMLAAAACRGHEQAAGPPASEPLVDAGPPAPRSAPVNPPAGGAALPVFYDPRQHTAANDLFSPSAGKPAKVVARWQRSKIPVQLMPVEPVTPERLALAHSREYVDGVLAGRLPNGFGDTLKEVAGTLPWTSGSLVSAAVHVAQHGGVAVSPTSGFHHAHYSSGGGFCTFNGLMVAVRVLQTRGLARKISPGTSPVATRATRPARSSRCCRSTTRRSRSVTRRTRGFK